MNNVSGKNALHPLDFSEPTKQTMPQLSNSGTFTLNCARHRYIVDVFVDREKAVFYKDPNSVTECKKWQNSYL